MQSVPATALVQQHDQAGIGVAKAAVGPIIGYGMGR